MPSLRSTRRDISWRCASTRSPILAPMSRPSAPRSRARSIRRCWPASTARRRSPSPRPACSPTPCRPMPIAAPAGRRPVTCWSGSPTKRRTCSRSTGPKSGGAISFPPTPCRTRRRSARRTTAATFPKFCRDCWRSPTIAASANGARERGTRRQAARLRHRLLCRILRRGAVALCRGAGRSRSASSKRPPSACNLTAACRLCSAPTITARATPRRSRKSSRRGLACRWPQVESHRRRYRSGAVRIRHVRLALDRGRRLGARSRRGKDHRQGQADRRASPRSRRRPT